MVKNIYPKGTPHKEIEHYDVLILGGGPAGLTAALYAGRYHRTTAVIAKAIGGTANLAGEIENWPGFMGPGIQLMQDFKKQAEQFGARFLEGEVKRVYQDENGYVLDIGEKEIHGRTIILALGTEHRKLNIPGEKEYLGKGVSYCATCDGMFFKNKIVTVVGGANSAAKAALYLADIAKKVNIIYRKNEMRCEPISLKKIKEKDNLQIYYHATPTEIIGNAKVEKIKLKQNLPKEEPKEIELDTDGIFIEIGATPINDIVQDLDLKLDEKSYIVTDKDAQTNLKGIYAAGDGTNNKLKQVVTAAAEGAVAAKSAHEYLQGLD